jgi:transposase
MVAERPAFYRQHGKESALEQMRTKPSSQHFIGVDIAYRTFTAASLTPGAKPKREPKAYAQTAQDFERFQKRLQEYGIEPAAILIVMEATGSYWVALATCLHQAGYAVSVINPAQAHYFAKAQLRRAKNDALDAELLSELAQALLPACWTPPPQIYHDLYQRLAQRANLLELRTQVSNQFHALSVSSVLIPAVPKRLVQLIETITRASRGGGGRVA